MMFRKLFARFRRKPKLTAVPPAPPVDRSETYAPPRYLTPRSYTDEAEIPRYRRPTDEPYTSDPASSIFPVITAAEILSDFGGGGSDPAPSSDPSPSIDPGGGGFGGGGADGSWTP